MSVEAFIGAAPRMRALAEALPEFRVEEELLLLWPDGDTACVAPQVLAAVAPEVNVRPAPTPSQVESACPAGTDLSAVARDLSIARRALAEAAADQGARLVAIGTPPFAPPRPVASVPGIQRTDATCGFEVHVQVPSRDLGAAVLERCRGWLPTLLALAGNSPLWRGRDTGWSSYRFAVQGRWPTLVPTPRSADAAEFAERAGGPVPTPAALEARSVHSWVRLSPRAPTVEYRIADTCSTVADAVLLTGLCRGLTAVALADETAGRPYPDVPDPAVVASARAAARWGLRAVVVDPVLGGTAPADVVLAALVATVAPALEVAGDFSLVTSLLQDRLRRGSGADRQRALRQRCDRQALVQSLANICAGVHR